MVRWTSLSFIVIMAAALYGCAGGQALIYQDSSLVVRLEPNPAGKADVPSEPRAVTTDHLRTVLQGLTIRRKEGLLQYVVGGRQIEPVFPPELTVLLQTELLKGFTQSGPGDRVGFQVWRTGPKGLRDETSGAMYLRGRLLHVVVDKFRVPARMSYEGAEGGSGKDFELLFEPIDAVIEPQGFATRWLGSYRPEVIINLQRLVVGPDTGGAPAADVGSPTSTSVGSNASRQSPEALRSLAPTPAPASTGQSLQQQLNELTESNQQLRKASATREDELTKVRQELAEAKQLLADKELELNRLKNKSGSSKRKSSQTPNER